MTSGELPEIRTRIDVTTGTLGVLLALGSLAGVLGSLSVGRVIERFSSRTVLIGGAIVLVGALPIIGFATTPAMFLAGMIVFSAFDVLVDTAMNLQGSWLSARRPVPVMNRLHGLWSLGTVIGGIVASQVAGAGVSLQVHLVIVAVVLLAVLVFVGRGLLVHDEHDPDGPTSSEVQAGGVDAVRSAARRSRRTLLTLMALIGGCSIVIELTSSDWAAFRLTDDLGAGPGLAGLGFVGFTAGMTIGRFGGDTVHARFGMTRLFRAGVVATATGLTLATMVDREYVVIAGFFLAGLGVATQFPKLYDDAAKLPGRPGAGLGALTGGSRIALLIAPIVVGSLAATSLSVGSAMAIVLLPALVGFVVLDRVIERVRTAL